MADEQPTPDGSLAPSGSDSAAAEVQAPASTSDARETTDATASAATSGVETTPESSDSSAPPPPDYASLWKQLEAAPDKEVESWRRDNPNHPVSRLIASRESAAARKAHDEAKAEITARQAAEAKATELQKEADARAAQEAEIEEWYQKANEGDYESTQKVLAYEGSKRTRQKLVNDPSLRDQARQDVLISSTMGVLQNAHWQDADQEALKTAITEAWNNAETPADLYGRLHTADLQAKVARGILVTAETHAALKAELDALRKEQDIVKAAEYQRGRTEGLGGRPDPEMTRSSGVNGSPQTWTPEKVAGLGGAAFEKFKDDIWAQAIAAQRSS